MQTVVRSRTIKPKCEKSQILVVRNPLKPPSNPLQTTLNFSKNGPNFCWKFPSNQNPPLQILRRGQAPAVLLSSISHLLTLKRYYPRRAQRPRRALPPPRRPFQCPYALDLNYSLFTIHSSLPHLSNSVHPRSLVATQIP